MINNKKDQSCLINVSLCSHQHFNDCLLQGLNITWLYTVDALMTQFLPPHQAGSQIYVWTDETYSHVQNLISSGEGFLRVNTSIKSKQKSNERTLGRGV